MKSQYIRIINFLDKNINKKKITMKKTIMMVLLVSSLLSFTNVKGQSFNKETNYKLQFNPTVLGAIAGAALLIGVGFLLYFGCEILWALLGTTFFTAFIGGLELKKQFLCFFSKKFIGSQEMKSFKMHVKRVSSKEGGGTPLVIFDSFF